MQTLQITVAVPCKNRCNYCPQDKLEKAYKGVSILTFNLFKKIIKNVPLDVVIHFSGFCEPYQNPDVLKMMRYVNDLKYKIALFTTTNQFPEDVSFCIINFHKVNSIKNPISRAGNLFKTKRKKGNIKCGNDNYTDNVVMPNGDVYLCCMDYSLKHKLGNLLMTNYNDLKRKPPFELCRYCELSKIINEEKKKKNS